MTIGHEPLTDTLVLVPGQDFIHDITVPAGESIPAGTTVTLKIIDPAKTVIATWPASVTSSTASWDVASEVADTISTPASFRIHAHYSDGADFCWVRGQVTRQE